MGKTGVDILREILFNLYQRYVQVHAVIRVESS